ncbi:GntR family transcriptional regulator [Actibacterium lipolyticum]|uniref:Putative HTH-type transcriptional regulator YdfH n=1 Tax=Actibacterium lipolyticum TaxID=1524263 RepID=A0A238JMQ3_9RHOB|nr:GntR family transcriptional regulator [Actibacterium lipolyticum]SMX31046.1 putative HTH-type transcriptional regulator YdfH [Actibacterium lipolyticum]
MNEIASPPKQKRTSVGDIVDYLYREITSLRLLPGTRISETDVAERFGVSRQPVRDAFRRLETMDLILVRPKKATEVKKFSARAIEKSRFVRAAVEASALREASKYCDKAGSYQLDACIAMQHKALAEMDARGFAKLDYEFHEAICDIGRVPYAFEVIQVEKAKVDRLCMLGLSKEQRMPELIADHEAIANAIKAHDGDAAVAAGMRHLSRLDETIAAIRISSAAYFDENDG